MTNAPGSTPKQQRPSDARAPETVSRRRRLGLRAGLAALAAAFLAIATIGFAPWTFSDKALIDEIARDAYDSLGLYIAPKGRCSFSLLPRPHIAIEGVALADANGFVSMQAERFEGEVRLLPLIARRVQFDRISLWHPLVSMDAQKFPVLAPGVNAPARSGEARFGIVSLIDGAVKFRNGDMAAAFESVDAMFEWRGPSAPATLIGSFVSRNERLQGLLWIARPGALARGDQTPTTWRLDGPSLHVEAEGMAQGGVKPRYVARLTAVAPQLRAALGVFNLSTPLPGRFENIGLSANASIARDEMQLTQLRLSADDNEFTGSFSMRREEERVSVQAALESDYVAMKPLLAYAPQLSNSDGQWSRESFDLPDLSQADIDLRLKAAHARFSRVTVDDAVLALGLRSGRMEFTLEQAKAYKGLVKAQATCAANAGALDVRAVAQAVGIDAGALLWDVTAREDISGALDAAVTLDAKGDSMSTLMRDLNGRATITLSQGAIAGIDFERALSHLDKRPLSSAIDIRQGRSGLDKASAELKIADGLASVEEGWAFGRGFALAFTGSTRVLDRSLALRAEAFEADADGAPRDMGVHIGFDLLGSWDEPSFAPDAKALIRRSGAAASLLRDRPAPENAETR
jgi:AsmA protein